MILSSGCRAVSPTGPSTTHILRRGRSCSIRAYSVGRCDRRREGHKRDEGELMRQNKTHIDARHEETASVQRQKAERSKLIARIWLYTALGLLGLAFALPFIWMVSTSLKDDPQTFRVPPIWIPNPMRFANYPEALTREPFG